MDSRNDHIQDYDHVQEYDIQEYDLDHMQEYFDDNLCGMPNDIRLEKVKSHSEFNAFDEGKGYDDATSIQS